MNKIALCTHEPISQQRRAAPLDFFCDFLQGTWMDNTPEEALSLWKLKVHQPTSYAADALYALDYVIANPPHDLTRRLQQNGWLYLSHEDDPDEPLYTFDEHLQWVRQMTAQFGCIYEKEQCPRALTLASLSADGAIGAQIYDYAQVPA